MRKRLSDWYEARDVREPDRRVIVSEIRQGKLGAEDSLLDLAAGAMRRQDDEQAQALLDQATRRNPTSWKAWKLLAEFYRHRKSELGRALESYDKAARFAPRDGKERALIFRELGILLRDSGEADAADKAIECLEEARKYKSDDVSATALASIYLRKGKLAKVVELLEPLKESQNDKTALMANQMLAQAYRQLKDVIRAVLCEDAVSQLNAELEKKG
jgi:tetratricopeptide (TPR) repeat protein